MLVSRNVSDHTIDIGVSSEVDYSVSIVSLNSIARSPSTDPVLAARGECCDSTCVNACRV